jgi:hypothetical protein
MSDKVDAVTHVMGSNPLPTFTKPEPPPNPPRMSVELRPFTVPNYVTQVTPARPRQEGFAESPKYALAEIDAETLARLCDEFRRAVFEKAGKADPSRRD